MRRTRTVTPPLPEDTDGGLAAVVHDNFRGVDGQLGEGSQTAVRVFRLMPIATGNSSELRRLKASTGAGAELSGTETEDRVEHAAKGDQASATANAGVAAVQLARRGNAPGGTRQ